jgi:hypothetical protein
MTYKKQDIIDEIVRLRLKEGYSKHSLLEHLKNTYGYKPTTSYGYIQQAEVEIKKLKFQAYSDDIEIEIQRMEELYQKALLEKNLFVAKDCLKEINKLKGLYIERQELKIDGDIKVIKLTKAIKDEKNN